MARSGGVREGDLVLLPGEALNDEDVFIDSFSLDDFESIMAPARVVRGFEIIETLKSL